MSHGAFRPPARPEPQLHTRGTRQQSSRPRHPRPRGSLAVSLMPAHVWGFFAQPLSWEQTGRLPRRASLGQLPHVAGRHPQSQHKSTGLGGWRSWRAASPPPLPCGRSAPAPRVPSTPDPWLLSRKRISPNRPAGS